MISLRCFGLILVIASPEWRWIEPSLLFFYWSWLTDRQHDISDGNFCNESSFFSHSDWQVSQQPAIHVSAMAVLPAHRRLAHRIRCSLRLDEWTYRPRVWMLLCLRLWWRSYVPAYLMLIYVTKLYRLWCRFFLSLRKKWKQGNVLLLLVEMYNPTGVFSFSSRVIIII